MPDNYETPVENVAPSTAVADAQSEPVEEEVTISADSPAQTGTDNTVDAANAANPPADGAQFQSQKDIDAAFGKRLAKERQKYEQSAEYQLGQMLLNERAQREGITPAEAYQRIQQERLDAKADAYAKDPKQFYKDLLSGNTPVPQRQTAFQPATETPQAQAQRVGEELANMYKAGTLPQGFDIQQSLDQDTYSNIVQYGAPAAMRIWAAEHGPAAELARRQSGPAPMRPTSSNKQSAPTDFSTISQEEWFKKRAEIRKAALDGKRVRLS